MKLHLEPRPTTQMSIRADHLLIAQLDRLAFKIGATRASAARALIRSALAVLEREVD
jgi:predicted transcriptional regulator